MKKVIVLATLLIALAFGTIPAQASEVFYDFKGVITGSNIAGFSVDAGYTGTVSFNTAAYLGDQWSGKVYGQLPSVTLTTGGHTYDLPSVLASSYMAPTFGVYVVDNTSQFHYYTASSENYWTLFGSGEKQRSMNLFFDKLTPGGLLFADLSVIVNGQTMDNKYLYASVTDLHARTPIPAAVWLLGTGLAGLVGVRRKFLS